MNQCIKELYKIKIITKYCYKINKICKDIAKYG